MQANLSMMSALKHYFILYIVYTL